MDREETQEKDSSIALLCDHIYFSYQETPVLIDISFHVHHGEFVALIGPNGAGKTTMLKLLLGLLIPHKGNISLYGLPVERGKSYIGYVPQMAQYDQTFPISVEEVVRMGRLTNAKRSYNKEDRLAVTEALQRMEIEPLRKRAYSSLSGGQRRRVLVARALSAYPRMLLLDEPTANMDVESEQRLFTALGNVKGDTTVLIVTHDTNFVSALTDRVLCLGDRSICSQGRTIVQHKIIPTAHAPQQLYGGNVLQVLHNSTVEEDHCCVEHQER